MSVLIDPKPTAVEKPRARLLSRGQSALSKGLSAEQEAWILNFAKTQWTNLFVNLGMQRTKWERFERLSDDDYTDRAAAPDREKTDAIRSIFERQNHTLGLVSGKCDQIYAQAKQDIFGTRPWINATPQGRDDGDLAVLVTKHSQWKFDQSNVEATFTDAVKVAIHLGTAFVKLRWLKVLEKFETADFALHADGEPVLSAAGDYVTTDEEAAAWLDSLAERGEKPPRATEWKEILIEQTTTRYDNVDAAVLDWKDVAFDATAPYLDLMHTPFFHRFKMGVDDLVAHYRMTPQQRRELMAAVALIKEESEARSHREENDPMLSNSMSQDEESNPTIYLVEGFIRISINGNPVAVRVVFSPELHTMFSCDYLQNDTPDGMLPVFAVRSFKVPRRIIGKGYWERFEDADTAVDALYNATTLRNRKNADIVRGYDATMFEDKLEGTDFANDPDKAWKLKPGAELAKAVQFAVPPDNNGRSVQLMQEMLQMTNMRMGTQSASAGEMTGVPQNDTLGGTKIIANQAAALDQCQIDQMTSDLRPAAEFAVHLIYDNADQDETFTWGEGRDSVLMQIKAGDVKGLRANVNLSLTQSQNYQRLEAAKAAIQIAIQYAGVPEPDKPSLRRLFIQCIAFLGFDDADEIIREGVVDPASIKALLPPETHQAFDAFLASVGLAAAPGAAEGEAVTATPNAPVTPT